MNTNISIFTEEEIKGTINDFMSFGSLKSYGSNAASLLLDIFFPVYDLNMLKVTRELGVVNSESLTTFILAAKNSKLYHGMGENNGNTLAHYIDLYTRKGFMEKAFSTLIAEEFKDVEEVEEEEDGTLKSFKTFLVPTYLSALKRALEIVTYAETLTGISPTGAGETELGLITGHAIIKLLKPSSISNSYNNGTEMAEQILPYLLPHEDPVPSIGDAAMRCIGIGVIKGIMPKVSTVSNQRKLSEILKEVKKIVSDRYTKKFYMETYDFIVPSGVNEMWESVGSSFVRVRPVELYTEAYRRNFRVSYIGYYKTLREQKLQSALDPAKLSEKVVEEVTSGFPDIDGKDIANPVKNMVRDILNGSSVSGYSLTLFEGATAALKYDNSVGQINLANIIIGEQNTRLLHLIGNLGIVSKDAILESFSEKMGVQLKYKDGKIFDLMSKSRAKNAIQRLSSGKVPNKVAIEDFDGLMNMPICEELYVSTCGSDNHELSLEDENYINNNSDLRHIFGRYGGALGTDTSTVYTINESRKAKEKLVETFMIDAAYAVPICASENTIVAYDTKEDVLKAYSEGKDVSTLEYNVWSLLTLRHNKIVDAKNAPAK